MVYAWLAVFLWSTVATAFKIALRNLTEVQLLWIAAGTAGLVLGPAALRQHGFDLFRQWRPSIPLGFLNPFLYYLVLFSAYRRLPAQEALVLNYTWPLVLTLLAALVLRRPFGKTDALALALGFVGVAFVATQGQLQGLRFSDPAGTLLALASAWIWGTYWILNLRDRRPPLPKLFWNFGLGFGYVSLWMLWTRTPVPPLQFAVWAPAVYVGLFEMGITFLVWLQALRRASRVARASAVVYLAPVLSLVWIRLILREPLAKGTLVGLAFILAGIFWEELRKPAASG